MGGGPSRRMVDPRHWRKPDALASELEATSDRIHLRTLHACFGWGVGGKQRLRRRWREESQFAYFDD